MTAAGTHVVATQAPGVDARAFQLLCLSTVCVLAVHATALPAWYIAALIVVLGLRLWQRRQRQARTPGWLRLVVLLAIVGIAGSVSGSLFDHVSGSTMICGLLVVKILETESARDVRVAIGFACFILMALLLDNQSLAMVAIAMAILLPALATLRALEPGVPATAWLPAFKPGAVLLAAGLPAALLAFLLIPRLSTPLWGGSNHSARTGMSDSMAPGDFHSLLNDESVAMRVGFDGPPPPESQRYFRGMLLQHFDGRTWTPGDGAWTAARPAHLQYQLPLTHYEVTLEPNNQVWLFTLDMPLGIAQEFPPQRVLRPDRTLVSTTRIERPFRYRVTSATDYQLAADGLDARSRGASLQLPAGFDPKAIALAQSWRSANGNDDAAIVQQALRRFHDDGYVYDLNAPPLGRDSVDEFLFATKAGYCEHYAGAFTFLMRAAGIPARVVVGYQGGYWNDLAKYLLIRQSNAHAWTEVWLAGRGWVRVDPTAAVSRIRNAGRDSTGAALAAGAGRGGWMAWRNQLDIVNRWWSLTAMGFDAVDQSQLLRPFGIERLSARQLGVMLGIAMLAALLLSALVITLRSRQRPRDPLAAAQWRLQRKLARLGVVRGAAEGPRDYYARSSTALPAAADTLHALAGEYLHLRYACSEPAPEQTRMFLRRVRHFRPRRVVQ